MHRLTRRDLLKLSAGAAVALGAPQLLTACGGEEAPARLSPTSEPKVRVAAVKGDDLRVMTRDALEAIGGARNFVNQGETVFIKPNLSLLPFVPYLGDRFVTGECTKPEIVTTVAEECLKAGAAEVIVGDGSQMSKFDWTLATTLDGSTNMATEAARLTSNYKGKVTLACLDADSPAWDDVPTSSYLGKVAVSSLITRADRIISVPVMKTHAWAQLTLSLKNFIGTTPLQRYGWHGAATSYSRALIDHSSPAKLAQVYLDIVNAVKPCLAIIDASIGVEGDGPSVSQGGETVNMKDRLGSWLLLASTDLVAADATAARLMSHNAEDINQIVIASQMGLGQMREEAIQLDGEKLDDLRVPWQPAKLVNIAPQDLGQTPEPTAHVAAHRAFPSFFV